MLSYPRNEGPIILRVSVTRIHFNILKPYHLRISVCVSLCIFKSAWQHFKSHFDFIKWEWKWVVVLFCFTILHKKKQIKQKKGYFLALRGLRFDLEGFKKDLVQSQSHSVTVTYNYFLRERKPLVNPSN